MRKVNATVVGAMLAAAALVIGLATILAAQGGEAAGPWAAGRCYRTSFLEPAQQQTLRVLEDSVGPWVRVQSDPISPRFPGAPPRARVWLNTATVFAIAEIECSSGN